MYNVWHLDTVSYWDRQERMARSERARLTRGLWASRRSSLMAALADWWRSVMQIHFQGEAGRSAGTYSTLEFSR